jgi:hypothetical protein
VPETQDTQPVNGTTTQTAAKDKAPITTQDLTPAFLPYSQTIIDRIDQIRGHKTVRQEEHGLDEAHFSGRRVTCECGVLADDGHLVRVVLSIPDHHVTDI